MIQHRESMSRDSGNDRRRTARITSEAIVVENLTKGYGNDVQALAGVSFTVRRGEIFGLLGPNGAGKSTTVRILATLTRPDGGRALVAGYDVRRDPGGVRPQIGYVAQVSGVDKYATGHENLTLQARLQRVPARDIAPRVAQLLDWTGLTDAADRLVETYSGGMKRRLDIAMGLVHEPAVLYLDEPTTGLDPEARTALWRDLRRLREERNLSVLLTTHYLDEADQLCDRLVIIDAGRVVVEGRPAELKAEIQGEMVTLDVDRASEQVATLLRPLDGVREVLTNGTAVVARVSQGATAVPMLISALEQHDVMVRAVTLSRPSLDDVYLYHTGQCYVTTSTMPAHERQRGAVS